MFAHMYKSWQGIQLKECMLLFEDSVAFTSFVFGEKIKMLGRKKRASKAERACERDKFGIENSFLK